ncbi:MAG: dTDP-4-dehydrorhamnose reductase [Cyanobacteriota bacterium]|jgi:dTDP-4-dehydrorhamnose reductase
MKVLLTGAAGQLGQALIASTPPGVELVACSRAELDLANPAACRVAVQAQRPDWVINAGAYTAVDQSESEPELAQAVNAGAPGAFAAALAETGGRLLQVSTDFVFNGAQGSPYRPDQPVHPLGVYGASKAAGEAAAAEVLEAGRLCILRTSWVYGPLGKNFLLTMLRLMREREQLGVVADQVGCPTATAGLAQACWAVLEHDVAGVHHWSDAGAASWYDFAVAISELGQATGLLENPVLIKPITTADYPTPAQRPSYSLLDCTGTRQALQRSPLHWREALRQVMGDLVA